MGRRILNVPVWLLLIALLLAAILGPLIPILVMASETDAEAWTLVAQVLGGVGALIAAGMAAFAVRNTRAVLQGQRAESRLARLPVFGVTKFTTQVHFSETPGTENGFSYGIQISFKNYGAGSAVSVEVEVPPIERISARLKGARAFGPNDTGTLIVYFPKKYMDRLKLVSRPITVTVRGAAPNLGAGFRQDLSFIVSVADDGANFVFESNPGFGASSAFHGLEMIVSTRDS